LSDLVLEDAAEYVFPIFSVVADGDGVYLEDRHFLGTGFFVTKRGDAITANHVLPEPDQIALNRRIVAIVRVAGQAQTCWINKALKGAKFDFCLFKVNLTATNCLPISSEPVEWGADVYTIGIPSHELHASGKEMRILKGHVTMAHNLLELSFAVPAGMSGAPLFCGSKVVGYATGTVRSEEVEDSYEELQEVGPGREVIRTFVAKRILHYGLACPLSNLANLRHPALEGQTLFEFIAKQNHEP
jgi:hypothetical protein